jgi:hypothetical protein
MRRCDSPTWTGWFRPQGRRSWLRAVEAESWSACWDILEATTADERGDTRVLPGWKDANAHPVAQNGARQSISTRGSSRSIRESHRP